VPVKLLKLNIRAFIDVKTQISSYLYKVELLKLRLKNLATCSSDRHKMGIKATAKMININTQHKH
jgi:hypothetical protein